jgi:hypothetical protein
MSATEILRVQYTPDGDEDYQAAQAIAQRQRRGIGSPSGPWQTPWSDRIP